MLMERTENNRDRLPLIIFQFTGKCSQAIKPGLKLSLYGTPVFKNPTYDFGIRIIPRITSGQRIIQMAACNNYLPTTTCLKNTAFANSVSLIPLTAIIHNLRKIYTEYSRIISAYLLRIRIARNIIPFTAIEQIIMVSEHESGLLYIP